MFDISARFASALAACIAVIAGASGCGAPSGAPQTLRFELAAAHCDDDGHRVQSLRFYLHSIELLSGDATVPFVMDALLPWQDGSVALISLPACDEAQAANVTITGKAPPGDYQGLRFTVGVPFRPTI